MEREKAELEVELNDGTIARVIAREKDHWLIETPDGERSKIMPPGHTTAQREHADARTVVRELGS